jgi:hypothetical protein
MTRSSEEMNKDLTFHTSASYSEVPDSNVGPKLGYPDWDF